MAFNYATVLKKNPKTEKMEVRASAVTETMTMQQIKEQIVSRTTVTEADVAAVIDALYVEIKSALKEGKLMQLGLLGSIYPTLKSDASTEPDTFNAAMIRKVNIRFRPTNALRGAVNENVSFNRVPSKKETAAANKANSSAINAKLTEQMEESEENGGE